ncbi:MAG: asparagine synthase (glutamine-hydrolyzing) [Alphaproteobacteria bacterium]|nr:asparagine synthase (glutamine-hydrolyzing) [Alphaproteobacteria bacterium]
MCGIAGFLSNYTHGDPLRLVAAMASAIRHRGPDDSGAWADEEAGIAMAHRRLSILDLSPAAKQPMLLTCGKYLIVFNGEIYNHLKLRKQLEAGGLLNTQPTKMVYSWRSHSDTETLLAAIQTWGLEETLKKCVGMFALAVWNKESRSLSLARDRFGEKPLYYGWQGDSFLFGSEIKALRLHPSFQGEIDRQALALYLQHNHIPAPYSIYQGIYKLLPGTWLTLKYGEREPKIHRYWSVQEAYEKGQRNLFQGSDIEASNALESLLRQSIQEEMVADVPLGSFLSGGIDSSTVVALMQAQSTRPVKTFTIGFYEKSYNEAEHAHRIAQHLGTDHTELYVTADQAIDVVPRLSELYDEPFADSSQIPTFLVAQLARQHVTVSLSGDGGDELFGGYNHYRLVPDLWQRIGWLPWSLRAALAGILKTIPTNRWNRLFAALSLILPKNWHDQNPGEKLYKLAEVLKLNDPEAIYRNLIACWQNPIDLMRNASDLTVTDNNLPYQPSIQDSASLMMYLDQIGSLSDGILTKVDRAAMGVSLETRTPFLDYRVAEFSWSLPLSMKIRHGQGKWLMRQVLNRYVPESLINRPKMGFGMPLDQWLRKPLREWAESLLSPSLIDQQGYFHSNPIQQKWQEHLNGQRNWQRPLWNILMFQAWLCDHNLYKK